MLTRFTRIDGRVQSILVGGHDVATVLRRDDYWNCRFYEYVDLLEKRQCVANVGTVITIARMANLFSQYRMVSTISRAKAGEQELGA
jgi:hypothetical protein